MGEDVELAAAEELARALMRRHGLHRWSFRFDKATRRFGCCDHTARSISLSRRIVLLNDVDRVRATVLHEIAHALAGPRAGHSREWREIAVRIGSDGKRCYGPEVRVPPKPARRRTPRPVAAPAHHVSGFAVDTRGVVVAARIQTRRGRAATQR